MYIHVVSLDAEAGEDESGQPSTHQHCSHDDDEGGGEDELAGLALSVADGQSKGNGPPQPSKHQHVLEPVLDPLGPTQVEKEGEDVDIDDTANKNGHLYA